MNESRLGVSDVATRRRTALGALLAALVALLVGWPGAGDLVPMETHEIFVARTAEEMHARGSILVPYYADEARLKKPPLSYWLVLAIDGVGADPGRVRTIEARLPSVFAAAALAALTVLLARRLGSEPAIAVLAGTMAGASTGVLQYAHNARPEMLYAALCAAGLLGFAAATAPGARRPRVAALLGWVAFGLAVLTKGPQLPLMLAAGWLLAERRDAGLRAAWRAIHGGVGVALMVAIGGAWPLAIVLVRDDALEVWRNETLGRVVGTTSPWRLLEPYYLYRPAALVAPWVVSYFVGVFTPLVPEFRGVFRRGGVADLPEGSRPNARALRLAWWLAVAAMVGLSFSTGRRWYYMLPALPPLAILMAEASAAIGRALHAEGKARWWAFWTALHAAGPALGAGWLVLTWNGMTPPAWTVRGPLLAWLAIVAFAGVRLAVRAARTDRPLRAAFVAVLSAGVALGTAAATGTAWRGRRHEELAFARIVGAIVAPDATLLAWREADDEARYHLHRAIPSYASLDALADAVSRTAGAPLLVDTHDGSPAVDRRGLAACVLATGALEDDPTGLQLWWLEPEYAAPGGRSASRGGGDRTADDS